MATSTRPAPLRAFLNAAGIDQAELRRELERVGVRLSPATVSRYVNGHRHPRLDCAAAIVGVLEHLVGRPVTVDDAFGRPEVAP